MFCLKYGALLLLFVFAFLQFALILRHKSPYISDSYFYKHLFYQMRGDSYDQAREKVVSQLNIDQLDKIGKKIFGDEESYKYSYSFFTKRPLYPFLALLFNKLGFNEFLSFLTPVFLAYAGSILLSFYQFRLGLSYFQAIFALALLIAFYPFLDWSTYFLTDTIGFFFWLLQLIFAYKFVTAGTLKYLALYVISIGISLLNREQSILMLPLTVTLYLFVVIFKDSQILKNRLAILIKSTLAIVLFYLAITIIFNQRTIAESINYLQNDYAFFSKTFNLSETAGYLIKTIIFTHIVFLIDLARHHWWFTFVVLGLIGVTRMIIFSGKKQFINLLLLSSGLASYSFVFIYPVLSYRFFYPVVIMIVYFFVKFIFEFFEERQKLIK